VNLVWESDQVKYASANFKPVTPNPKKQIEDLQFLQKISAPSAVNAD